MQADIQVASRSLTNYTDIESFVQGDQQDLWCGQQRNDVELPMTDGEDAIGRKGVVIAGDEVRSSNSPKRLSGMKKGKCTCPDQMSTLEIWARLR